MVNRAYATVLLYFLITIRISSVSVDVSSIAGERRIAGHQVVDYFTRADSDRALEGVVSWYQDKHGRYWFGTTLHGIVRYDEGEDEWCKFRLRTPGQADDTVLAIVQSDDGILWSGTQQLNLLGVRRFDGSQWTSVSKASTTRFIRGNTKAAPELLVSAMFDTERGEVWFCPPNGLIKYAGGEWTTAINLAATTGEPWPVIARAGIRDSVGDVWLGTETGLLIVFRGGIRFVKKVLPHELADQGGTDGQGAEVKRDAFVCAYEDQQRRLWFGTRNGVVYVHERGQDSWRRYELAMHAAKESDGEMVPSLFLSCIYQDFFGQMLFGTNKGLIVFREREGQWEQLTPANSPLKANWVTSIREDSRGRIWLLSGGVAVLDPFVEP